MTAETSLDRANIRASRTRVARTRGAFSGVLLVLLGAWAALVPFIGPYFDFAFTPSPDDAWHWTTARGWLEVAPGAAAVLGGLLLFLSSSRITTSLGGWLAAAGGAWLIVGPPLADVVNLDIGSPDPTSTSTVRALESLFFFFAIGAAILFVASVGLGRLSVHSVRDVHAAERRAELEQRAEDDRRAAEERRIADQQRADQERRRVAAQQAEEQRRAAEQAPIADLPPAQPSGAPPDVAYPPVQPGQSAYRAPNTPESPGYPPAPEPPP